DDAPATGLKRAFALPPDDEDYRDYIVRTFGDRLAQASRKLGLDVASLSFAEQVGRALVKARPALLIEGFDGWWDIILRALVTNIKAPGSKNSRRPHENAMLAETYAEIEDLKQKKQQSVRSIAEWLPKARDYKERYRNDKPDAIRKRHELATKLKNSSLQFNL